MLSRGGRVVVMDFGLAGLRGSFGSSATGVIDGTPEYVSPEQARGQDASPRSDIYALGLTWWYLLCGRHMISGERRADKVRQHLVADLPRRVAAEPLVPATIRPLLSSMVERDPDARPRSDAKVVAWLHRIGTRATDMPAREAEEASSAADPQSARTPDAPATTARIEGLMNGLDRKDEV